MGEEWAGHGGERGRKAKVPRRKRDGTRGMVLICKTIANPMTGLLLMRGTVHYRKKDRLLSAKATHYRVKNYLGLLVFSLALAAQFDGHL